MFDDRDYFLSARNPLATIDQREVEALAMRLWERPDIRQAHAVARLRWLAGTGVQAPEQQRPLFDAALEEYSFNYLLKAANADPQYPRIVRNWLPAHRWLGHEVRGARMGGENPDNAYRTIPIEHGARYALHGRVNGRAPADVSYTLVKNFGTTKTVMTLEGRDVPLREDGSFRISIGPDAADGRPDHLQTQPGTRLLFIRDSLADWEQENPNALRIRRLDPPTRPPMSEDEIAALAAEQLVDDVPLYFWFTRIVAARKPNLIDAPQRSGWGGGLVSQASALYYLHIEDDEAFVLNFDAASAGYFSITVHDWWFQTLDPWKRLSSLNNGHLMPDADGRYTCVISAFDPGVPNWIDSAGLRDLLAMNRWQALPRAGNGGEPQIEGRVVRREALASALPGGTPSVTPEQRARLLVQRERAWMRRVAE
jgi:hypothetical protein